MPARVFSELVTCGPCAWRVDIQVQPKAASLLEDADEDWGAQTTKKAAAPHKKKGKSATANPNAPARAASLADLVLEEPADESVVTVSLSPAAEEGSPDIPPPEYTA